MTAMSEELLYEKGSAGWFDFTEEFGLTPSCVAESSRLFRVGTASAPQPRPNNAGFLST
jgi:hypothetical protein